MSIKIIELMSLIRDLNHDLLKAHQRAAGPDDVYLQATKSLLEKADKLLDKSLQST